MSRKKQQTYGEMARLMAEMQKKMEAEKGRMAEVMASALLDDKAAALLGDFSDADLRRVMVLLAGHVEQCAAQVNAEKQARKEAQKPQEAAQASPATAPQPAQQTGQPWQSGGYSQQ